MGFYTHSRSVAELPDVPLVPKDKGKYNGSCNRTVCGRRPATHYNHSTERYYCRYCAKIINQTNHKEAMELYGHDLCTPGFHPN